MLGFAGAAPAQTPSMAVLGDLQRGLWEFRVRGSDERRRVCLGDPVLLLQVQHGSRRCSRYLIDDKPDSVRVSYKCGASGHGVTSLRKETSTLISIDTQGIYNNAPFSSRMEGRRTGGC